MDAETPNPKAWKPYKQEEKETQDQSRSPGLKSGEDWPELPSSKPAGLRSISVVDSHVTSPWASSPWRKVTPEAPVLAQPIQATTPESPKVVGSLTSEVEAPTTLRKRSPSQTIDQPTIEHPHTPITTHSFGLVSEEGAERLEIHHPTPLRTLNQQTIEGINKEQQEGKETASTKTAGLHSPAVSKDEKASLSPLSPAFGPYLEPRLRAKRSASVTSADGIYPLRQSARASSTATAHLLVPASMRVVHPPNFPRNPATLGNQVYPGQTALLPYPFYHQYPPNAFFYSPYHGPLLPPVPMPPPLPHQGPPPASPQHARSSSMSLIDASSLIRHLQSDPHGTAARLQARSRLADQLGTENENLKNDIDRLQGDLKEEKKLKADLEQRLATEQSKCAEATGMILTLQALDYNKSKQAEMLITEVNRLNREIHKRDSNWPLRQLPLPPRVIQDVRLEEVAVAATAARFGHEAEVDMPCYMCNRAGHMSDGKS